MRIIDRFLENIPLKGQRNFIQFFTFTAALFINYLFYACGKEWLTDVGFHLPPQAQYTHAPQPWPLLPNMLYWPFVLLFNGLCAGLIFQKGPWRIASLLLCLCFVYFQHVDSIMSFTLFRYYTLFFALITFAPSEKNVSEGVNGWFLRFGQVFLVGQYIVAGWTKYTAAWATDTLVLKSYLGGIYQTTFSHFALLNFPNTLWELIHWSTLVFELGAPLWFFIPKIRPYSLIFGICFHLGIALMMDKLIFFSLQMISFYWCFLPYLNHRKVALSSQ